MALFRYSIYDDNDLLTFDYVKCNDEEEAFKILETYKEKVNGNHIKLKKVCSPSEWENSGPRESR